MTKQNYVAPELELLPKPLGGIGLLTNFSLEGMVEDFEGPEIDGF